MSATARLMPVVAALLVALVDGSLSTGPTRAEDVCLPAPNAPAPLGSHWHYRTDPVKQSKCWYLRTEGPAIQKQAVQETPESGVGAKRPAPTSSKSGPGQLGSEPLELRPGEAAPAASADRPKRSIQNNAQPSRLADTNKVAWSAPPLPPSDPRSKAPAPAAVAKVARPDPPSRAVADKVAWPDPPSRAVADKVAWADPPSPAAAGDVAWPDPPSPTRGAARDVAAENTPAAASTPEETGKQTQEVPTNSIEKAGNDIGANRHILESSARSVAQDEVPFSLLLAFAIGLVIAGLIVRRIVKLVFGRRPTVSFERREPVWTAGVATDGTIPTFATQDRQLAPGAADAVHLQDDVKKSLRKLLMVLEEQAV